MRSYATGRQLRASYSRIDVLANNTGGLMGTREVTLDGFEKASSSRSPFD
ncbi:hypothetical protein [Streptomyces sp. 3N207]